LLCRQGNECRPFRAYQLRSSRQSVRVSGAVIRGCAYSPSPGSVQRPRAQERALTQSVTIFITSYRPRLGTSTMSGLAAGRGADSGSRTTGSDACRHASALPLFSVSLDAGVAAEKMVLKSNRIVPAPRTIRRSTDG